MANCSFESGFSSWVVADLSGPFFPLTVGPAGVNPGFGLFTSAPTDGTMAALNGWGGNGPGTISIAQDVTLPAGVTTVEFDYRKSGQCFHRLRGHLGVFKHYSHRRPRHQFYRDDGQRQLFALSC